MGAITPETEETEKWESEEDEVDEQAHPILPPMAEDEVREIEIILQYRFKKKKLLFEAFTHGSFCNSTKKAGKSYERLEFVGDSILGYLMARELFSSYRDLLPGQLTILKAANVDTERLSRIAVESTLHLFLRHKTPELPGQIQEFMEGMNQYPIHSNGLLDPPKVLADIVESVIGAIFMDSNSSLDTVWKVFKRLAEPLISLDTLGKHPVSELNHLCQKNRMQLSFSKDTWAQSKTVDAFIDGHLFGSGTSSHKKDIAQKRAAKAALDKLETILKKTQIDLC